jgi:hypothetical protein
VTASAGCAPIARLATPAPRHDWQELLDADRSALVTQTPAWTDALCAVTGAHDASRLYEFGEGRRLVLPMVERAHRPWPLTMTDSFPPAWGFGGLAGDAPRPEEARAVLADLRSAGVLRARIRPNPLHHHAWSTAMSRDVIALPRRAHVVDLGGGFDRVWMERFSKRARNHVRRAERCGLEVELDTTGRLAGVFEALFTRSVERWARRQHEPAKLAHWRARRRDPPGKLARVMAALDGAAHLWVASAEGRPVAAILVLQGANAHYTRGAMDEERAGETRANYLLHARAIEAAARAGCGSYHMGETGDSRSLAQFKEAVGGRPHRYAELVVERLPITRVDRMARTAVKTAIRFRDHD